MVKGVKSSGKVGKLSSGFSTIRTIETDLSVPYGLPGITSFDYWEKAQDRKKGTILPT